MIELLKHRGFTAYLLIAFLNAATDIGHKIIIQNAIFTYYSGSTQIILTAVVNALILLPFALLFTPSGFLADKYPKDKIIVFSAALSIPIALLITACYYMGWFQAAFALTLLLAIQSAFYAPAKYGYIKELVGKEQLAPANSYIQAVTIVAILLSSFVFSIVFESLITTTDSIDNIVRSIAPAGWLLVVFCSAETLLSMRLERKRETDTSMRFPVRDYLTLSSLRNNMRTLRRSETIWLSIVGLSIFWGINQVVLASLPEYLKDTVGIANTVVATGMLAVGGVGIVIGSILAGRVSRHFIETGVVPLGAVGMTLALFLLPSITHIWVLGALFLLYGVMGGLFIVPLNALIQFHADERELGKIMAGNNFVQTLVMLLFLLGTTALVAANSLHILPFAITGRTILYVLFAIALGGTLYTLAKLPQSFIRYIVSFLVSQKYKLRVNGVNNIPSTGGVLLLGNHTSFVDWAILQIVCPRHIRFVMARQYYSKWYLRHFLKLFGVIPISSAASKEALASIQHYLNTGEVVALFPEGRISKNGHISAFQKGFELVAQQANTQIVPFYIRGLWGSMYSFASKQYRRTSATRRARTVAVSFGAPLPNTTTATELKQHVVRLSIQSWHTYADTLEPVHIHWLRTAKRMKGATSVVNFDNTELSSTKLLAATIAFAQKLRVITARQQNVGLLLPPSTGCAIANLAVLINGNTVVHLNYTAGKHGIEHALSAAGIRTVLTSRQFLQKLESRGFSIEPTLSPARVVVLEDVRASISKAHLLATLLMAKFLPTWLVRALFFANPQPSATAAILFSSGSEGTPKGVELSHRNIVVNIKQIASVLNPQQDDIVMSSLPLFHAFGLTVSTLMPLVEGLTMVCQPDPTDAVAIGKQVAKHKVTLLFGTSTFLGLYTRNTKLQPLMFQSLRMVVAGAEKLHEQVRMGFREKFGHNIYEGYGTTETTPVAGVNLPDILSTDDWVVQVGQKVGTVGMALPGSAFRIVQPDTLEQLPIGEAGLILIAGPQLMKGYLHDPKKTKRALVEIDGLRWYKTGDKGQIDEDGFLTILDRYSRFAKVGGEMVGLTAVETAVANALPPSNRELVAVAVPNSNKGESIVLLISNTSEQPTELQKQLRTSGVSPLLLPSTIFCIDAIPRLGSGKTDFVEAKRIALRCTEQKEETTAL